MLVTAASITDVVNKANLLMVKTGNWFQKNKLILNSTKSNIMLFKTNRGRTDEPQKVWWNFKGILYDELSPDNQTVTS